MLEFIKRYYPEWLNTYVQAKQSPECAYESLLRLLRRFAARRGFSQRVINLSLVSAAYFVCSIGISELTHCYINV